MNFLFKLVFFFSVQALFEDKLLHKVQRGLFISKPKYGIFVTAFYKKDLPVNDLTIRDHILDAVRDVVNYALELEEARGNGTDRKFNHINHVALIKINYKNFMILIQNPFHEKMN